MGWLQILVWILANLPELISLIRRFWTKTSALAPIAKEELRLELVGHIRRRDKAAIRALVFRVAA